MKWIFLIGNSCFNIDLLKKMEYCGCISSYNVEKIPGWYCIDYGNNHVFLDTMIDIQDFEDDINDIPIDNPTIIMLTYTSAEIVRNILRQDDFPKDIYIDNDLGIIVPLRSFIEMGMPLE